MSAIHRGGTELHKRKNAVSRPLNEKHLITLTQSGDTEAFSPLVEKYHPRIYTHILGRVKNRETAKDLTQETWLKAFRSIHTFRCDSAFSSWIYRIAENVCIDFFRKQKTEYDIAPLHTIDERCILETYPDPSQSIETQECRQVLRTAIQQLPPMRKKVFLLRYVQELPIKKIATLINRSEGTVKTHLSKAHHQLRDLLIPYLKNEDILWLV